ncbi:MAG: DUF2085 domain-containing protein [Chloroflexi bacterium]|nr:DUF2085 domain-containing protein [Chloroflexota bacterium]
MGTVGDWIGCHQIPERSFFFRGVQYPICARCTGVLLGQLVTGIVAIGGFCMPFTIGILLMVPMGIDWGIQYLGIQESTNVRRFVTGFLGGCGYVFILAQAIRTIMG